MAIEAPPYLKSGDKIALVATARKVSENEMCPATDYFKSRGLELIPAPELYVAENQFAGSSEHRAKSLQWALDDPSIKAVLCARGGYGTIKMLDKVDLRNAKTKWIAGFSDVTIMLNYLNQEFQTQAIHGPMAIQFTEQYFDEETCASLVNALMGENVVVTAEASQYNSQGDAVGELTGGNLSMLYSAMGTPYEVDTNGKILFLEDLDEYLYHVDRMMMNLKASGKLEKLAGLAVGGLTKMNDNTTPFGKNAEEIILEAVEEYNFPVAFNLPCGHATQNIALKMGAKYNLSVGETTSLTQA